MKIENKMRTGHRPNLEWDNSSPRRRLSVGSMFSHSNGGCSNLSNASMRGQFAMPMHTDNLYHFSALLLVDISGFTRLSTLLDVDPLSNAINTYFDLLIREVEFFDGDVLKFAGDAFFAAWIEKDADEIDDLEDATTKAALCGASMVEKFSGYEVPGLTSDEALLDVHCGIGVGQIAIFSVGNNETRREMLFLGKPVDQVAEAETMAKNGEVAASPEAIALLTETCDVADNIIDSENPRVIAYRGERYFEPLEPDDFDDIVSQQQQFSYKSSKVMQSLKHQMSLYVHPAARLEGSNVVNAEIRSVFTIFIKPEIIPNITGDRAVDDKMLSLLNDIMNVTIKELDRFKGHLRQFIIDDKGVVLIATFGQRGATFPQMVTEKGLPATIAIYEALMIELDVRAKVGATFGKAYCGVVGGVKRHEFAILGPSVNLAARLMTSKDNPGILVDNTIRQKTCKRFDFLTYAPVKAKGYADLVPVFEPRSLIERQWNVLEGFVGRENELNILLSIVKQMIKERNPTRAQFVLIDAHSGYGKSCLAMQAMYSIRRIAASHKKEAQVYKGVCEDSEQLIPFAVFRNILLSLLMKHSDDQYDYDSDISSVSGDGLDAEPAFMSDNLCRARLHDLCKEMKKSEDFVDVVGTYLLGLPSLPSKDSANGKAPSPNDLVDFVASIFLKYSVNGNLIVLALDDIQWMDSLSWEVLELLLKRGKNLFILCMSRPNAVLQKGFINRLRKEKKKKKASYFTEISLLPFTENDTRDLIALALDCEAQCVDDEVTKYLYDQSGGMPYFAQELITNIVKKDMLEWNGDIFQWRCKLKASEHKNMYTDLNELLLFRLDEMKSETRILLQVCAVLGFEFSLSEVILVQCKSKGKLRNKQIRKIHDLLKETDKERILVESGSVEPDFQNEKTTDSEGAEKIFRFSHAIWRNCVLGTMLKERKCDLHRSVAKKMENQVIVEDKIEPRFAIKLVHHWKACDEFLKAGIWARKIGVHYSSRLLLHQQAKEVCLNAIQMWKEKLLTKAQSGEFVAGFHIEVLNSISPEELECLGRLHIDVGKYYSNMMDGTNAHLFYRNCELILEKSSSVADLKNRTVFFTL